MVEIKNNAYDEWGICRETIVARTSRDDGQTIEYPKYALKQSEIRVILYESLDGSKRHGYKLLVSDQIGIRIIADSAPKFYTRGQAIEEGRKSALTKKNLSDSRIKNKN